MFYEVEGGEIKEVREIKEIGKVREVREVKEISFSKFTKFSKLLKFSTHPTTNLASEWCGSGASQKRIPRDSTISTALGILLFGMCR